MEVELWMTFSVGKKKVYISAHMITHKTGDEQTRVLPMFYAFTGCDTISCFTGRGGFSHMDIMNRNVSRFCSTPDMNKFDEIGSI